MNKFIKYFKLTGNIIALALAASCLVLLLYSAYTIILPSSAETVVKAEYPVIVVAVPFCLLLIFGHVLVIHKMWGLCLQEREMAYHLLYWSVPVIMPIVLTLSFYGMLYLSLWLEAAAKDLAYFF